MRKQTIGMALYAATFFALSGSVASAESNTETATQKPAKAEKKASGKKHAHAHKCKKCGKAEKDCACEDKKHDGHEDEHGDHAHDKAEEKK
jgi:hypothetical protein